MTTMLFDTVASVYDDQFRRSIDQAEDQVIMAGLSPYVEDRRVLDVGCGTGSLLDHHHPRAYLGLDASPNMLRQARHKHGHHGSRYTFLCSDCSHGSTIIRPGLLFDTALCLWALPYFQGQASAIKWMSRHLRPGGTMIIQGWSRRYLRREHHIAPADTITTTTPIVLRAYLRSAGLVDVDVQGFRWLGDHAWMDHAPINALAALYLAEAKHAPARQCLTHFAAGRKPGGSR